MDNLDLLSRPVNYITYEVVSNDGKEHDVEMYFEASPRWALDQPYKQSVSKTFANNELLYLTTGSLEQNILHKKGDDLRINWGYFYMVADNKAAKLNGYTAKYELNYIKKEARNVIIPGGINTIAVYCKQHGGGQFIDAGIVKIINSNDTTLAFAPRPFTGATNQNTQLKLQWRKANLANSYKLYLGIDPNLVDSNLLSTQTDTFYNATGLKQGVKYYWRVDAVNENNTKTGYSWNFTTQPLTGINNLENSISDSYPNPVKNGEILHVRSGNAETFEEIEIWSSSG